MISRRRLCTGLLLTPTLGAVVVPARADDNPSIRLLHAALTPTDQNLLLSINWEFELPESLLDSLQSGIPLYFICSYRLMRSRWYWFNKELYTTDVIQRISFSPLSRQYRYSRDGLSLSFNSLDMVMPLVKNLRDWSVDGLTTLKENQHRMYAEVRLWLDLSRLPKPLQVAIGGAQDWALDSDWQPIPLPSSTITQ